MKRIIAAMLCVLMLFTSVFAHPFSDVNGHWAEKEIDRAYTNKIVNGDPSGTFRPNANISRAEFAKMLSAIYLNLTGEPELEAPAEGEHWAQNYYAFGAQNLYMPLTENEKVGDIIPGVMDATSFDLPIERWEMAYLMASLTAFLYTGAEGGGEYADAEDVKEAYPAVIAQAIDLCNEYGVLKGDENGKINAGNKATRAEAITVINRIGDKLNEYVTRVKEIQETAKKEMDESRVTYDKIPSGKPVVTMVMSNNKKVTIELYPEVAPQTVANFVALIKEGFYDGLTFHRVVDGFMAQGGDPKANGTGGSGKTIVGEFASNGFETNTLNHERGIISMARSAYPDSASSQFFICYADLPALDGQYAAFGKVTSGMEVIDSFVEGEMTVNSMGEMASPVEPIVIKKMTVK